MSAIDFLQRLLDAGLPLAAAMTAAREHEAVLAETKPLRSKGAERTRRWREGRHQASQTVTSDVCDDGDVRSPSLPSSPQTPQQPTHPPGEILPARKGPSKAGVAKGFLAFWSAYPKRVGKDAAAKAFSKALTRIDDPDPLAVILAGIERALPGWDDPQFIPHPSTWLTQGRWADETPEPRTETRNDRPSSSNRPGSSYAQPSRAERDQSAALRVLAARGALPGQGEGGRVHDLGPARPAAAGG